MMTLRVNNLGKAYRHYYGRWSRLLEWCLPSAKVRYHLHWALQGIAFDVLPGEAIGIAGMNGAGKSTLLKIIAGTTKPTTGNVEISGRVAALLELGMGFHPEFTGRENAIMAGQLLSYSVDEIKEFLPEIEAFAEIGEAIDQPVRTYSSGMHMRLAFAVATARRPDLLIIDEALSVGDSYFQHKSFSRIRGFRESGTTLLLVSHDRTAIQSICDRVVLLHEGKVIKIGSPEETMDFYHALLSTRDASMIRQEKSAYGKAVTISGGSELSVADINLFDLRGRAIDTVETGEPITLEIKILVNKPVSEVVLGFMIKDRFGQIIYGINSYRLGHAIRDLFPGNLLIGRFQFEMNLGKGNYSISTALSKNESHLSNNYEWRDGGFVFSVLNTKKPDFVGYASLDAELKIQVVPSTDPLPEID
ncbi:MAG: ABC transporter ATP-binding protein [Desulfobacteraceae bacterium]|nr:ABC transporter ATP-binding protein [Desulfobacteraceae bacterium]